ncbi:hypothetical protein BDV06DRAFT_209849 [Aspergillus oleicola]
MSTPPDSSTTGPLTIFPGEGLPDIKRYITTHNAQSEGIFLPADNGDHQSLMADEHGVQSIMYTTQRAVAFNRNLSLDYGVVFAGEFEVELDSDEKRIMRRGDVLVQRDTLDKWKNLSTDKPGRRLFVLLDVKPLKAINGRGIKEELAELLNDFLDKH